MSIKAGIWPIWGGHTVVPLWKRAGLTGVAFFLVKGLLWLVMPVMLYLFKG